MESESVLSQEVYLYLQTEIGTPAQVDIRRQTMDIEEIIFNSRTTVESPIRGHDNSFYLSTGSQREGFNFEESDVDTLFWLTDHKVICHPRQENLYDKETLIMMEYCDDSPGSAFLKVRKLSSWSFVRDSYVKLGNGTYMSSLKYSESTKDLIIKNSRLHGPCASGQLTNGIWYDYVHSLKCDFLPQIASSWIKRCETKGWPDFTVLQYARKTGCNFVPIGRRDSPNKDYEWRISFNLIELRCVHSMNHVQFTCYGLFKIFLTRVIKPLMDDKELLCSYFLKTIMFYTIQESETSFWSPGNLIKCFWNCFKCLIFCTYKGNLPNFFIQENMFHCKIEGSAKEKLLEKLYVLYNMGYACLTPCVSEKFIRMQTSFPLYWLRKFQSDYSLFTEIHNGVGLYVDSAQSQIMAVYMLTIKRLLKKETLTLIQTIVVKQHICSLFTHLTFVVLKYAENTSSLLQSGLDLLEFAAIHGFISNNIFKVMYLYRMSRFKDALDYAKKTKGNLKQPHVIYIPTSPEPVKYIYDQDKSWTSKIREDVAVEIFLSRLVTYLDELSIEQYVGLMEEMHLVIHPYVLTLFLIILCKIRLGDIKGRDITLCELKDLLYNDKRKIVPIDLKNTSWHILGIAQQLSGYYSEAFESYRVSLTHSDRCVIFKAKIIRMLTVVSDLRNKNARIGLKRHKDINSEMGGKKRKDRGQALINYNIKGK